MYGSALCDVCHDVHFQSAAQTLQQIGEAGGPTALFFNYFTTLALRYAVMVVIPQIKVCGFYSPSPRLPHSHTYTHTFYRWPTATGSCKVKLKAFSISDSSN